MSKTSSPESHRDDIDAKLIRLRKATVAVEKLLYGELANSPLKVTVQPNWSLLKLPLAKLTMVCEFDCAELARILTTHAKLVPDSKPVQDAARWLIGVKNNLPADLQNPAGLIEIHRAADSGNTEFFSSLGDCLRNKDKPDGKKKGEFFSEMEYTLAFYWHPIPKLNWPGLAYCTDSARWDFLEILGYRKGFGENYLGNLAGRKGLISSKKSNRFVSSIKVGKGGQYRFS